MDRIPLAHVTRKERSKEALKKVDEAHAQFVEIVFSKGEPRIWKCPRCGTIAEVPEDMNAGSCGDCGRAFVVVGTKKPQGAPIPLRRSCKRCGQCCEDLQLHVGPDELEESYRRALRKYGYDLETGVRRKAHADDEIKEAAEVLESKTPPIPVYSEILLIYPMLVFKFRNEETLRWHYRCKHFARDASGLGCCTINDIKPYMCRVFPFGRFARAELSMGPNPDYPSQYEGCRFNTPALKTGEKEKADESTKE